MFINNKGDTINLRNEINETNQMLGESSNYELEAGVKRFSLPYEAISNPDNYIKPLDIVWIKKQGRFLLKYFHVCVYLGKGGVCHIYSPSGKKNNGARTDSWAEFLSGRIELPIRFHPIIPFKHKDKIIEHIAKASVDKYKLGKYDLTGDNCEHFANKCVLGLQHFSRQSRSFIDESFDDFISVQESRYMNILHVASSMAERMEETIDFNLTEEIRKSNAELGNLASDKSSEVERKIREIKDYTYEALIEVPTKDCVIM